VACKRIQNLTSPALNGAFLPRNAPDQAGKKPVPLAGFSNLVGPDLIIIALIFPVLAIPFAIAISIVFMINRRRKMPPPLPGGIPQAMQQSSPSR
jgi:hypothetical protein